MYLCITIWLIFRYVSATIITRYTYDTDLTDRRPLYAVWNTTAVPIGQMIPEKYRTPAAAVFVVAVILAVTFGAPQTEQNSFKNRGISLAGLIIFYAGLYLTSADRKRIVWRTVLVGLLCQFIVALFVLRTKVGYDIFNFVSFLARYATCLKFEGS